MQNITIKDNSIVIGKKEFSGDRIKSISSRKLSFKNQFCRMLAIMFQFSSVGWLAQYYLAGLYSYYLPLVLSGLGLLYFIVTFRRYELRALLTAIDETGEQYIVLARSNKADRYAQFQEIKDSWGR